MLFVPMILATICTGSMKQKSVKFALQQCLEKKCGEELGFDKKLAFSKQKWCPHKVNYFIPPSQWLGNVS